jgi:hypothetical protein
MAKTKIDPKNLVKVGRLKQVTDSLTSSANYKDSALKQMIPVFGYDDDKVRELLSTSSSDRSRAKKYGEIINKAKAAAAKSKK